MTSLTMTDHAPRQQRTQKRVGSPLPRSFDLRAAEKVYCWRCGRHIGYALTDGAVECWHRDCRVPNYFGGGEGSEAA